MPITVLLADDTKITREAIRRVLNDEPKIRVVGEAANFAQTMEMCGKLKPQVLVMDLYMPDHAGSTVRDVRARMDQSVSKLLAISVWSDEDAQALAQSFGAVRLLDKIALGTELVPTIVQLV
jgi:DNA-binding NarL/FixJ family response regulator